MGLTHHCLEHHQEEDLEEDLEDDQKVLDFLQNDYGMDISIVSTVGEDDLK